MKIPSNNRWTQTNEGKKLGILGDSFNIDLETPGQLIGAKKSVAYLHQDSFTNLSYALSVVYYADDYIVITPDEAYRFSLTSTTGSTIASYPSGVTVNSDGIVCYNRLYTSLDTNLSYWDGSSWTNSIEALTTGLPHPMEVFDSQPTYKLAIGNGNSVILVDSSGNKSSTELTLPAQFRVTTMRYRNGYLYVGTRNIYGGEARVFIWSGSGTNAQYEVPMGASWVFSMTPYQNSVACVTDRGKLIYIDGSTPVELASFPVAYAPNTRWQDHLGLQLNGKVFNRGMAVVDNSIYINIDGEVDIGECLEMKSGLWIYNPDVGLYHHAQASADRIRTDSSISITDSEITTSADHYLKTGDAVVFTSVTGLTNVTQDKTYYAYVTDTNKLKLAKSRQAIQDGEYMTIAGSVTSETLMYAQNRDQGVRHHTSGAIARIVAQERVPELFAGEIMYGALVDNLDGDAKHTIQILTDSFNVSRFTTQRIYSESVEQSWKEVYTFIDGIRLNNERQILKYGNISKDPRKVVSGTWSGTDTINCLIDQDHDLTDIDEGDEVVIVDGYGRGYSTFIASIENTPSVYSFTLTESLGTDNQPVKFYTTPLRRVTSFTNQREQMAYTKDSLTNVKSSWVVLGSELRGFQTEVSHFDFPNVIHKGTK